MITYLIKRLLLAIPVLLVTAVLVFSALHLAGGDPVMLLVPANAPQETREAVRAKLGLDKPLPVQFVLYMSNVLQGDLGRSILSRREVSGLILEKLPDPRDQPITHLLGISFVTLQLALECVILQASTNNHQQSSHGSRDERPP